MENPYSRAPLQVTLYDVSAGAPVRSYMFLGSAPRSVLEAAQRGRPKARVAGRAQLARPQTSAWPEAKWASQDEAALQRHYGSRWRWLLTPRVGLVTGPPCDAVGGGRESEADFGYLGDFDRDDFGLGDDDIVLEDEGAPALDGADWSNPPAGETIPDPAEQSWDPRTVYVGETAYPEDSFADLKAKIYAATGVPPYRQHLFYGLGPEEDYDDEGERPVRSTYRVTVEGNLVLTDVRRFARQLCLAEQGGADLVAGVPVDRRLEERKEDVRVDALDAFRTLEESPGVLVRRVFVADLAALLQPRTALVQKALADRYQFDLLYYGVVLKYWPTLSPEAFRLAVASPAGIAAAFPLLAPPAEKVRARLALEQRLIDQVYSQTKAQTARRDQEELKGGLAVTGASVVVEPRAARSPVNVRNILDWVPATRLVPAMVARVPAAAAGRGDRVVEKTHVSAQSRPYAGALGRFLTRPPKRPGVAYAVVREAPAREAPVGAAAAPARQPQFVYLTVYDTGRYTIESTWREDDRVGFDEVVEQLSEAARPIIEHINSMGAAALPLGGALETPSEASRGIGSRTTVESVTVSFFWPHALTSEGFRDLKKRWREYERAGIAGVKGLQQAGAYAFWFRKGIVKYDPRAMERVVSRAAGPAETGLRRQVVTNHYTYLTDPAAAQRWLQIYSGRLVRVHHRSTDLRVEVANVDLAEYQRIRLYVTVFLDGLLHGPGRLTRGLVQPGQARPAEGRLRSLQERDPDLYDLKKYDEGATVYSVLCQGARQPEMLTEEEVKALPPSKQKANPLVPYWNFTESRPAYYRCPSRRFPHLSFRAGEHPLGYCLPCCKKTRAFPGSKAQAVNRLCLQQHALTAKDAASVAGDDPLAASRHVLSYGKEVPVGRLARAPRQLVDGLFYDALPRPFEFRLVGVTQQTASLPDAGYFFAVAAALSLEPDELAQELADTAVALRETYRALAGGAGGAFASADDLGDAIVATFAGASDSLLFSPFTPGGAAAGSWRDLVADLTRVRFDVEVAVFADAAGDGNLILEAPAATAARLREPADVRRGVDVALLVSGPSGTYPLVAMDQKEFLRHAYGRGPARRFFSADYDADDITDRVVEFLCGLAGHSPPARGGPGLEFVADVCRAGGHRILYRLINLRDMCYGVVVAPSWAARKEEWVYYPVPYSPHTLRPRDDSPGAGSAPTALYGPRPDGAYPAAALAKFVGEIGAAGGRLSPSARLVDDKGQTVGFIAAASNAFFHHDPVAEGETPPAWAGAPVAAVPYNMRAVDRAIYEAGGAPQLPPLPADKVALAERGLYRHRLYRLFVAEFAALLRDERNQTVRAALRALFKNTRFSSPSSLASFRRTLAGILRDHPDDAATVRSLVASTYGRVGPAALREALAAAFEATSFEFDRVTLSRLRALGDHSAVAKELRALMRDRVELESGGTLGAPGDLHNIYAACSLASDVDRPQCARGRLKMEPDRFDPYVSILAADVLNPLKASTLGTMASGVVDEAHFATRPGERVLIR